MIGPDEYNFRIDAYSPSTIPMARLAEYMAQLAALLGQQANVHFLRLEEGSTCLIHRVDTEAAPKVRVRLETAQVADPDDEVGTIYRGLDDMLRADNAIGALSRDSSNVLRFPGREQPKPRRIGPFNQFGTLDGVLLRIGGRDKTAHATIEDADGITWNCIVTRDMARELAHHLFGDPVRLSGIGRWERSETGRWELHRFTVQGFHPLQAESLAAAVNRVRLLNADWNRSNDPIGLLQDMRNDDDEVH